MYKRQVHTIPPIYTQIENDPDDYEQFYSDLWSAFRYRSKEEAKEEKKSSRIAWAITLGAPITVGIILWIVLGLWQ